MAVVNDDGKTVMHAVTLENVCFVMSLRLRDMYLEAHPALLPPLVHTSKLPGGSCHP